MTHHNSSSKNTGFSLVEMLIVATIISIVATTIFASISGVTSSARIDSATSAVMDKMKEIRHKSTSVKEFQSNLFPSYGIYFDISTPQKMIVYADCKIDDNDDGIINNNDTFIYVPASVNCNGGNGFVEEVSLNSHVRITEIRSVSLGTTVVETKMYMEYVRPEPSVWISDSNGIVMPAGKMEIDLTDTSGKFKKTISFWNTGQISVK